MWGEQTLQVSSESCLTAVWIQSLKISHKFCFKCPNINFCRTRKRIRLMRNVLTPTSYQHFMKPHWRLRNVDSYIPNWFIPFFHAQSTQTQQRRWKMPTILRCERSLMTSAMSARMSRRVTAESRARAARTMVPLFTEEQGSSANSDEAIRIVSPGIGNTNGHSG